MLFLGRRWGGGGGGGGVRRGKGIYNFGETVRGLGFYIPGSPVADYSVDSALEL